MWILDKVHERQKLSGRQAAARIDPVPIQREDDRDLRDAASLSRVTVVWYGIVELIADCN
jgi:hypothetical protein